MQRLIPCAWWLALLVAVAAWQALDRRPADPPPP